MVNITLTCLKSPFLVVNMPKYWKIHKTWPTQSNVSSLGTLAIKFHSNLATLDIQFYFSATVRKIHLHDWWSQKKKRKRLKKKATVTKKNPLAVLRPSASNSSLIIAISKNRSEESCPFTTLSTQKRNHLGRPVCQEEWLKKNFHGKKYYKNLS